MVKDLRIPIMRPTKFTSEMTDILSELSQSLNTDFVKNAFPRIHKDNIINRRIAAALNSFNDVKTITERMEEDIKKSLKLGHKMQSSEKIVQRTHRAYHKINARLMVDLRSLYIHSKIFLDDYVKLIKFTFDLRGIADRSVTSFFNSLKDYTGKDNITLELRNQCLNRLKAIDDYVTTYRDKALIHNEGKHNQKTEWFRNMMNGEIKFDGGNRPSMTPQGLLFTIKEFVDCSNDYLSQWIKSEAKKTNS